MLEEIGYGMLGGVVGGLVVAVGRRVRRRRGLIADPWLQVIPVAGAALAYGMAAALGGSGFIAAFVAGIIFGCAHRARTEERRASSARRSATCSTA